MHLPVRHRRLPLPLLVAGLVLSCPAESLLAQSEIPYRRVDEGIEDVDPLARSFRQVPPELRLDDDFENIYQFEDGSDLYMRRAGAIVAVFPRSEYIATKNGVFTEIPPGTTFYLGPPSPEQIAAGLSIPPPSTQLPVSGNRQSTLVTGLSAQQGPFHGLVTGNVYAQRIILGGPVQAATPPAPPSQVTRPLIMSDELYRRERLRQIAARALERHPDDASGAPHIQADASAPDLD